MLLPKNKLKRIGLLVVINLLVLSALVIGTITFLFIHLGWGASSGAPTWDLDWALLVYLLIMGLIIVRTKPKEIKIEIAVIAVFLAGLFYIFKLTA